MHACLSHPRQKRGTRCCAWEREMRRQPHLIIVRTVPVLARHKNILVFGGRQRFRNIFHSLALIPEPFPKVPAAKVTVRTNSIIEWKHDLALNTPFLLKCQTMRSLASTPPTGTLKILSRSMGQNMAFNKPSSQVPVSRMISPITIFGHGKLSVRPQYYEITII